MKELLTHSEFIYMESEESLAMGSFRNVQGAIFDFDVHVHDLRDLFEVSHVLERVSFDSLSVLKVFEFSSEWVDVWIGEDE